MLIARNSCDVCRTWISRLIRFFHHLNTVATTPRMHTKNFRLDETNGLKVRRVLEWITVRILLATLSWAFSPF